MNNILKRTSMIPIRTLNNRTQRRFDRSHGLHQAVCETPPCHVTTCCEWSRDNSSWSQIRGRSYPWSRFMVGCRLRISIDSFIFLLHRWSSRTMIFTFSFLMSCPCSRQCSATADIVDLALRCEPGGHSSGCFTYIFFIAFWASYLIHHSTLVHVWSFVLGVYQ